MVKRIIVADASPLIAFGRIDRLSLLKKLLGTIIVPDAVLEECLADASRPGAEAIAKAIDDKILKEHPNPQNHEYNDLFDILGKGEATAIVLALQLETGLLIDEKLGRNTAKKLNLPIIGTAGVLLLAKRKKLIKKIKPLLDDLKNAGYFLSK